MVSHSEKRKQTGAFDNKELRETSVCGGMQRKEGE
jgi:hypothetical protein